MNEMNQAPNSGKLLVNYFVEKRIYKAALARLLKKNYKSLLDLEKRSSIQTKILWELSHALKHNFFMDFARELPENYSKPSEKELSLQERITQLEHENELLKAKLDLLTELMRNKLNG